MRYKLTVLTERHWGYGRFEYGRLYSGCEHCDWAIHHRLSKKIQELLRPVLCRGELEQFWILIDEVRVNSAMHECRVVQHVQQEWCIRLAMTEKILLANCFTFHLKCQPVLSQLEELRVYSNYRGRKIIKTSTHINYIIYFL